MTARFLADKSALVRFGHPDVTEQLRRQLEDGLIATCDIIDLEVLFSAQTLADYEQTRLERRSLPRAPITATVTEAAIDLQHRLAERGEHRVPIPDLLISAAAREAGLAVLHYDRDFERIEAVGGAAQRWIAPAGSL